MIGEDKLKELVTASLVMGARRGSEKYLKFDEAKALIESSIDSMTERFTDLLVSGEIRVPTLQEANIMHELEFSKRCGK